MTEAVQKIYNAIRITSHSILRDTDSWKKRLVSSKNFVCSADLQHWTFGKSVGDDGDYHNHGGVAKKNLYGHGFINVLKLEDQAFKEDVIVSFRRWAKQVNGFPIEEKFNQDRLSKMAFELLVHKEIVEQFAEADTKSADKQASFDEGFSKQIVREIKSRSISLVQLAKRHYGSTCSICNFNFGETYGELGEGFIEMHHLKPIHEGERVSAVEDLRPVCSNCHRMLHRGGEILSIEELKEKIEQERKDN